ncbi:MAG: TetR/AcrR family transcriptional regulator [Bacteroidia bacterium]|jgi:AcrR family transcriptional regulator|nr:TetR/AcrR family transcriptional regulator [Bacteroidia bacterium]
MTASEKVWILAGYETFAIQGEQGLKVEALAKKAGISKSSFYHHFADVEIFLEQLLHYHLQQVTILAEKERNAPTIDPDLIHILIEHKTDLLFNRQLRFHRNIAAFNQILVKSNETIGTDFVILLKNDLRLSLSLEQLKGVFDLAYDNFFLQINPENITYNWLSEYFRELRVIVKKFESAPSPDC